MKKIFTLLIDIVFSITILNSQVAPPQAFSFKATIQGTNGQTVVDKMIRLRISILQDDMNGFPVYSEFFTPTTDHYSQVNVEIGRGNVLSGIFSSIDWSAHKYFLKIEVDAKGGTSYQLLTSTQLLSVPYALYAGNAGNAFSGRYGDLIGAPVLALVAITGEYNDLFGKPTLFSGNYNDLSNKPSLFDGTWNSLTGKPTFSAIALSGSWRDLINTPTTLTGYGITDAMNISHPANGIAAADIANWNTAFGWGNHAGLYRPIGYVPDWSEITSKPTTLTGYGITDAMNISHPANGIAVADIANWNTAFSWGNHTGLYLPIGYVPLWSEIIGKPTFATVATSGSYNDLNNKPTIDGSETKVTAGTNVTVTGVGTTASPYVINSTGGSSGSSHFIGESYGGGIVFYVYDNGQHGLIAATVDQSTGIRWYGGSNTNTRARADGVGAGLKNTAIIIANQGPVDGNAFAATLCNEYSVTVGGVTYGDWYLPSKYELNLLYLQKSVVGGFANWYYWSSTENNSITAWYQVFDTGSQNIYLKQIYSLYVRAVRAF